MNTRPGMRLAETAIARLCHDLSSSLGAVMNALELAGGDDELAREALELAQDASRELSARLRLARALWAPDGATTAELIALLAGLPNAGRILRDTAQLAPATLSGPVKQLILAAAMLAAEGMHGAGEIVLAGDPAAEILVLPRGPSAAWPAPFVAALGAPKHDLSTLGPRDLMSHLVPLLASEAGANLSLLLSGGPATVPAPLLIRLAAHSAQAASPAPAPS